MSLARSLDQIRSALEDGDVGRAEAMAERLSDKGRSQLEARFLRACIAQQRGRQDAAIAQYRCVLEADPNHPGALQNLAVALEAAGDPTAALVYLQRLTRSQPRNGSAFFNLGNVYLALERLDEARDAYRRSAELDPRRATAWNNLGVVYKKLEQSDLAAEAYRRAIDLEPSADAYVNLMLLWRKAGNEAAAYEVAREVRNRGIDDDALVFAFHILVTSCDWAAVEEVQGRVLRRAASGGVKLDVLEDLLMALNRCPDLDPELIYELHRQWGDRTLAEVVPYAEFAAPQSDSGRLRLGYVSGDFRHHSVGYFIRNLIATHDRSRFEIYCYSRRAGGDELTEEIAAAADAFIDVSALDPGAVARRIHEDGVQVLVDLAGHTGFSGIKAMAYRPAPLQLTYLGYPNTSGLSTIDYRITDRLADEPGGDRYVEELLLLPESFLCFGAALERPVDPEPPSRRKGYITFGSFNHVRKLTPQVIALWSRILQRVPGSRFLLKGRAASYAHVKANILAEFQKHGITEDRVEVRGAVGSQAEHLDLYNELDIALDTFPYHGTTTTCEALWMGVPVLTLVGSRHVQRVSYSILENCGLRELVTGTEEEYVDQAVALAENPAMLEALHRRVPKALRDSVLCQPERFTAQFEETLLLAWHRHQGDDIGASAPDTVAASTPWITIQDRDGLSLRLPDDPQDFTSLLLQECEDWPSDEVQYLRSSLRAGDQVLDWGALDPVITLKLARWVGTEGGVRAVPEAAPDRSFLLEHIAANGLAQLELLDVDLAIAGLVGQPWDLVRIPLGGGEQALIEGFAQLWSGVPPLIWLQYMGVKAATAELLQFAADLGLSPYRLVPGLNCLVPVDAATLEQSGPASLFLATEKRAAELAARDALVVPESGEAMTGLSPGGWVEELAGSPYSQGLLGSWERFLTESGQHPAWRWHQEALDAFVHSQQTDRAPVERYNWLALTLDRVGEAVRERASVANLQTLARVALELGHEGLASSALDALAGELERAETVSLDEPFVPASARFQGLASEGRLGQWLVASVLEPRELLRAPTAHQGDEATLKTLELLTQLGFSTARLERRRQLVKLRLGLQERRQGSPLFEAAGDEALNPALWANNRSDIGQAGMPGIGRGRKTLRMVHNMARAGGTLVGKCLGSMEGVCLLSEIHPHPEGLKRFNPMTQAQQWYGLFDQDELEALAKRPTVEFVELIAAVHAKCQARGWNLVIRDWAHLDFTAIPFLSDPSFRFATAEELAGEFDLLRVALVRHPIDQWLSLSRLKVAQKGLDMEAFLRGYRQFAEQAQELGFLRYEDFVRRPDVELDRLCTRLELSFDPGFRNRWSRFTKITGDVKSTRGGDQISVVPRRPVDSEVLDRFGDHPDYQRSIAILGYRHPR